MKFASHWFLVAAVVALTIALTLYPVFGWAQTGAIFLATLAGGALTAWAFGRTRRTTSATPSGAASDSSSADLQQPQIFALGKLFEATMGGMREGLLVVDSEMRVVASNHAAY